MQSKCHPLFDSPDDQIATNMGDFEKHKLKKT